MHQILPQLPLWGLRTKTLLSLPMYTDKGTARMDLKTQKRVFFL
jgi:hypothetical protein